MFIKSSRPEFTFSLAKNAEISYTFTIINPYG